MFWSKLKKWKKVLIGSAATLMGSTAIVAPILTCTSCGANKEYIDAIDEKFNISSATYKDLKKKLKAQYRDNLEEEMLPDEQIKSEMEFLQKDLNSFDNVLKQSKKATKQAKSQLSKYGAGSDFIIDENQKIDYTTLTNGLVELASQKYKVKLNRNSTATWEDIRWSYKGLRDSIETYMRSLDIPEATIQMQLAYCDKERDRMMADLMDKYGNDALSGYVNGLPRLMECFASINIDVAAIAGSNVLKDFFDKYTLVFDEKGTDNRYDQIESQLVEGGVISDKLMDKMFDCIERRTGNPVPYDPEHMIEGYVLTPTLHKKIPDPIHNSYKISIDWSIINKTYLNSPDEIKELATGHMYRANQDVVDGKIDPNKSIAEVMRDSEREYLEYSLYPTASYEASQLAKAYFNKQSPDGYIRFKWHDNLSENKYEQFFSGIADEFGTEGTLTLQNLADSGLQVSANGHVYTDANVLLDRVGEDKEVSDEDALTLDEKFIRYCNISSHVKIVDPEAHYVTNKFSIEYRNSYSKHDAAHWYTGLPIFNNIDYPVSPEFFVIANKTYNYARQWVNVYRNKKINDMYDQVDNMIVSLTCSAAKTAIYTAYYTFRLIVPLTVAIDGVPRPNWACALGLAISQAVLLATYITLVNQFMINPMKGCVKRNDNFLKSASFQNILKKIDDDQEWFCMTDENGNCDKGLYNQKMKKFCSANFQTVCRPLYQFYGNFHQQELCKNFVQGIVDNQIDSVTIQSITDKFALPTGLIDIFGASYTVASMAINLVLGPVTNPFKPWHWGMETWLWALVFMLEQTLSLTISGVLYIVTHTVKKFITGNF